jgi:hypothetical protein
MLVHWIGFTVLAVIALVAIAGNLRLIALGLLGRKGGSLLPLVGGVAGTCALLLIPLGDLHRWCWLPLLADPGCSLLIVTLLRMAAKNV